MQHKITFLLNNLRRAIVRYGVACVANPTEMGTLPKAVDEGLEQLISTVGELSRVQGMHTPLRIDERSNVDLELPVVGFTTEVDNWPMNMVHYTASTPEAVQTWKGKAEGAIEPVVRKRDAEKQISALSDMVVSLEETIQELRGQVESGKWRNDGAGSYVVR